MIGNKGAAAIGFALRDSHCKLENLDLSFNGFGGGTGNQNPALEFSQALFTNINVKLFCHRALIPAVRVT